MTAISNLDISSNLNLTDLYNNLQSAEQAKLTPLPMKLLPVKTKFPPLVSYKVACRICNPLLMR